MDDALNTPGTAAAVAAASATIVALRNDADYSLDSWYSEDDEEEDADFDDDDDEVGYEDEYNDYIDESAHTHPLTGFDTHHSHAALARENELAGLHTHTSIRRGPLPPGLPQLVDAPALLEIQPIARRKIALQSPETWRNNLIGISRYGFLFVADGERVKVFRMTSLTRADLLPFTQLLPPKSSTPTVSQLLGANNPLNLFSINNLRIGTLGGEEYVAILTDAGQCVIYATAAVMRAYQAVGGDGGAAAGREIVPVETLQVAKSAWGVDFCDRERLIAVSDNSRSITIFKLGYSTKSENQQRRRQRAQFSGEEGDATPADTSESTMIAGKKRQWKHTMGRLHSSAPRVRRTPDAMMYKRVIEFAHDNNIPCIKFVDLALQPGAIQPMATTTPAQAHRERRRPSTRATTTTTQVCIMSTSIDGDVKIWDLSTLECVTGVVFSDKKGWTTLPLWKHNFTLVPSVDIFCGVKTDNTSRVAPSTADTPAGTADLSRYPRLSISYPVKSRSPFMTVPRRRRRTGSIPEGECPYEVYEDMLSPLFDFEASVDPSARPMHYELGPIAAQQQHTPLLAQASRSSYFAHPIMPPHARDARYDVRNFVIFHSSLYQARLIGFDPSCDPYLENICPSVFGTRAPVENFTASFNRLNMTLPIPELGCVVVASQEGLISVFKLCRTEGDEHEEGRFGMKQEIVLTESKNVNSSNTLLGMDVRPVVEANTTNGEDTDFRRRYVLFLVFLNGGVAAYELRRHANALMAEVADIDEFVI
ncbi:CRT10-domain-containing protein [Limtongia smithiae]|uniref:CRT10-domain-containing protein n=1 Tax=Limtongia smithiae TaxID=1125753 RepID=UPI0034CE5B69